MFTLIGPFSQLARLRAINWWGVGSTAIGAIGCFGAGLIDWLTNGNQFRSRPIGNFPLRWLDNNGLSRGKIKFLSNRFTVGLV